MDAPEGGQPPTHDPPAGEEFDYATDDSDGKSYCDEFPPMTDGDQP